MRLLRREPEIALYEHNGNFSLEAYFGKHGAAGISGVLIAELEAQDEWILKATANTIKRERTSDGGEKLSLASQSYRTALLMPIISVTYIPSVRLDDNIVRNRFGEPESIESTTDGRSHYGYGSRGIIVSLDPAGKTIITYTRLENYQKAMRLIQGR